MNTKKKIGVTASSIVGLKAELFRKQEQFKKEKLENQTFVRSKLTSKKPGIWNKQNSGVEKRDQKDKERKDEEEKDLNKSRSVLEAKAAMYDKMSKGELLPEDDELYMVDFTQKIIGKGDSQRRDSEEDDIDEDSVPDAANPDEEWVDYVDSLGRSRRCMRKDLEHLKQMDRELQGSSKPSTPDEPDLLSEDMRREMLRQKWEEEEEAAAKKPVGPLHYQNVKFDEVRNLGVGYYGFSREGSERQKQLEQLEMLRDETVDQRVRREKLKEKRKAAVQARLEKVKQRKKLRGNVLSDVIEETKKEPVIPVEPLKRDETIETSASLRPWDKGKVSVDKKQPTKMYDDLRDQRLAEFAPPVEYFGDKASMPRRNENAKFRKSINIGQSQSTRIDKMQDWSSGSSTQGMANSKFASTHTSTTSYPDVDQPMRDIRASAGSGPVSSATEQYPENHTRSQHPPNQQQAVPNMAAFQLDDALSYFRQQADDRR